MGDTVGTDATMRAVAASTTARVPPEESDVATYTSRPFGETRTASTVLSAPVSATVSTATGFDVDARELDRVVDRPADEQPAAVVVGRDPDDVQVHRKAGKEALGAGVNGREQVVRRRRGPDERAPAGRRDCERFTADGHHRVDAHQVGVQNRDAGIGWVRRHNGGAIGIDGDVANRTSSYVDRTEHTHLGDPLNAGSSQHQRIRHNQSKPPPAFA